MARDPDVAPPRREPPEYEEITLADIVRVLHRRKLVLFAVFILAVIAGAAYTFLVTPEYEASASIIPLEHQDIIQNWLDSRHAAERVVAAIGTPLKAEVMPARWNEEDGTWIGSEPTDAEAGRALLSHVEVAAASGRLGGTNERLVTVTVTLSDPVLARNVANGYLDTLSELRPDLENITRQDAFDQYYDGTNEQEAQNRAEVTARQTDYWLVLDRAITPDQAVSPNVVLNMALAVVLGLVLGVFTVFFTEWLSNYRAETKRLRVPEQVRLEEVDEARGGREGRREERPKRRYG